MVWWCWRDRCRGKLSDPIGVLLALVLLFLLARAWDTALSTAGIDFYQFWAVGRVAGTTEAGGIYSSQSRATLGAKFLQASIDDPAAHRMRSSARYRGVLETYSSPFLYSLFASLSGGDYETDYRRFQALSLVLYLTGVLLACRALEYLPATAMAALCLAMGAFEPCVWDVKAGNVNRLLVAGLGLFLWLASGTGRRWRDLSAGAVLGWMTAFKPTVASAVLLVGLARLLKRRYQALGWLSGGAGAAAAVAVLWSSRFYGAAAWPDWLTALRAMPREIIPMGMGNYAPARLLQESVGLEATPVLAAAVPLLGAACLWLRSRREASLPPGHGQAWSHFQWDARALALGCLVYLAASPLVWGHHLLLSLPAVLVLLAWSPRSWAAGATVLAATMLATTVSQNILRWSEPWQVALVSSLGNVGLLALGLATFLGRPVAGAPPGRCP